MPNLLKNTILLLISGLDDGQMYYTNFDLDKKSWLPTLLKIEQGHHKTIKKLKFQPKNENSDSSLLATCGADSLVQLIALKKIK